MDENAEVDDPSAAQPAPGAPSSPRRTAGHSHSHSQGHGHGHSHSPAGSDLRANARHRRRLEVVCAVLAAYVVVQVAVALFGHSLALLSDAGHMVTDVLGMAMSVVAIRIADRQGGPEHRTFGLYRLEILAALANALLLLGVSLFVLVEAIMRLRHPATVHTGPVLAVAALGVVANLAAFAVLRGGAKDSLNVAGAYLEVVADLAGTLGVLVGTAVLAVTGWAWVDPAVGIGLALFIVPRTVRLGGQAVRILVEAAPHGVDIGAMASELGALDGVVGVHDLHVWTLTSDMVAASAHLVVERPEDTHAVLDQARHLLGSAYAIDHATLQVEPSDHEGCQELTW